MGERVLVLLPTSTKKLLAQWQGPYPVLRKVGPVTYEVDMFDRTKRRRILHVNMLRKWYTPLASSYWTDVVPASEPEEEDVILWKDSESGQSPVFGQGLDNEQRRDLFHLLDDFADVLRDKPGRTTLTEHTIETGAAFPTRQHPYRLPQAYKGVVQEELKEMLAEGIVEPSASEWAAPIVLVRKKDGSFRFCVDYRKLNSVSRADAYPMPRMDELIDNLGQAQFITTLDLTRGYWQVPMAEVSRAKTAFTTGFGLYQFRVMPFGLQGAPATFQRLMDQLLTGLEGYTAAYLDDLVIYSNSWTEHLEHVQRVLTRLREAGLTVKPKKCQFGMKECVYLGHVVGNGTVKPEHGKLEAVQGFPIPETKSQVRAFLGLTGYYWRFIPDYSSIAAPLTDLTKKYAPTRVIWSEACEAAFQKLKEILCKAPVLQNPDFNKSFILQTDASDRGIGAVLSQEDSNGEEHPVAYFSKKLLPREERYSTVEKECLAIKLGIQAFRVYLMGRPFVVQTDHRSLIWLDRLKENNARLTRWSLALQPYQFIVKH